jgi:hypothetical protein
MGRYRQHQCGRRYEREQRRKHDKKLKRGKGGLIGIIIRR